MKNNNNDTIIHLENNTPAKEKIVKIKKKLIDRTAETYKKLFLDKINGRSGEC